MNNSNVEIWKELQILFEDMLLSVLSKFEERMSTALTPAHYLAHHLDPKYQTKNYLTDKDINTAMSFLQEHQPSALSSVLKYRAKSSPFLEYMFSPDALKVDTHTWWKSLQRTT